MSTNLGLGVMIQMLRGDRGSEALRAALGKTIKSVRLDKEDDGALRFVLGDGSRLTLRDTGRSCCESRYMTCDDDLATFAGAKLIDVTLASGPEPKDEDSPHETMFLRVETSAGVITACTHNEHNGYYGGFALSAEAE